MNKAWNVLCIGNSFSQDTTRLLAKVALSAGMEKVKIANLYIGGCSVRRHWLHARKDMPVYRYEVDKGNGILTTPNYRISQALLDGPWDWVCIQHGTADGSFYTRPEDYDVLPRLIEYVRGNVASTTRIAFNMAWVGEPDHTHREILYYGGNQMLLYRKLASLTQQLLEPMPGLDRVCPTGTAVQNARTAEVGLLTRDGYHLSLGLGRYIAAMAFFLALTGADGSHIKWRPEGVDSCLRDVALWAVKAAVKKPYSVTAYQK